MSDARLLLLPPSFSFFLLLPPPSSPDLICQLLIAVSLAGSHLPALDSNGPCRTSTGESLSAVGLAGPQPARVGALWASPDLNLARPQPDLNGQKQSHIECQRECQIECQIECQKICQIEGQIECQKICQIECQKIYAR